MLKLLIDECLSGQLALLARRKLTCEASHVVWIGKSGWKDWEILQLILKESWTLVTRNSIDFRGPRPARGSRGQLAGVPVHAGLICINAAGPLDIGTQLELFTRALQILRENPDLTNQVLEVSLARTGEVIVERYAMPA